MSSLLLALFYEDCNAIGSPKIKMFVAQNFKNNYFNLLKLIPFVDCSLYNNFRPPSAVQTVTQLMEKNGLYGYMAGFASAVLLQPLDNIKMVLMMPPKQLNFTNNFIKNGYLSIRYLANDEGFKSFYKGLTPNILKNGFASAVFFFSLRMCEQINKKYQISIQSSFMSNFVCSGVGRIFSAIACNPFVILETRFQMAGKQRWSGSMMRALQKIYVEEGLKGYFNGCLTNCVKEGIFAGLFYGMYEEGKKLGFNSTFSGLTSGMIATLMTHPLQIVRTQLQTSSVYVSPHGEWLRMSIKQQLVELAKSGELLKGVSPRLIKKPMANTLSFLIFQAMESTPFEGE